MFSLFSFRPDIKTCNFKGALQRAAVEAEFERRKDSQASSELRFFRSELTLLSQINCGYLLGLLLQNLLLMRKRLFSAWKVWLGHPFRKKKELSIQPVLVSSWLILAHLMQTFLFVWSNFWRNLIFTASVLLMRLKVLNYLSFLNFYTLVHSFTLFYSDLLRGPTVEDGTYLCRFSANRWGQVWGDFNLFFLAWWAINCLLQVVLSVKSKGKVTHIVIQNYGGIFKYKKSDKGWGSIPDLIEAYKDQVCFEFKFFYEISFSFKPTVESSHCTRWWPVCPPLFNKDSWNCRLHWRRVWRGWLRLGVFIQESQPLSHFTE